MPRRAPKDEETFGLWADRQWNTYFLVQEMLRLQTMGYSARGACLAVGVRPSTGRRWLKQLREAEDAR